MNPVTRIFTAVLAVMTGVGAFLFGLAVVLVLAGSMAVLGAVIWLRAWWLAKRKGKPAAGDAGGQARGAVIDAEYTVVSRRRD